jgi:tRNA threonylcarbamoyl adenosine modification protein YjeE
VNIENLGREVIRQSIATPEQMNQLGAKLGGLLQAADLVVLTGPLGAGKTTLTRGVGAALGCIGTVSSPTFVIARTHKREGSSVPLVHVDAYRLKLPEELDDLGIDFENSIVLVEWGRGLTDGLSDSWLDIEIERDHTGETEDRLVTIRANGERWAGIRAEDLAVVMTGGA